MNCWTERKNEIKERIVKYHDPDIICMTETHLQGNENINLLGYTSYRLNRKIQNRRSNRGSGGVSVLLRSNILTTFQSNDFSTLPHAYLSLLCIHITPFSGVVHFFVYQFSHLQSARGPFLTIP